MAELKRYFIPLLHIWTEGFNPSPATPLDYLNFIISIPFFFGCLSSFNFVFGKGGFLFMSCCWINLLNENRC